MLRKPYSEGTLTRDYPFFVDSELEAYAMVKAFFEDYRGMYARFEAWFLQRFVPELERRNDAYWPPLMQAQLDAFRAECADKINRSNRSNEIVDLLVAEGPDRFVLRPRLKQLTAEGKIRSLTSQLGDQEYEHDSISFSNNWNEYRLRLIHHHGFCDAGLDAGDLARSQP